VAGKLGKKKCDRKIAAGKVRHKNHNRKSGRKIATEKSQQWICNNKTTATERYKKKKKGMVLICVVLNL
jgi:hypothetical protein